MNEIHKRKIGAANHARFVKLQDKKLLKLMISMYLKGKTLDEISADTEKPRVTVYRWLKWSGTEMRKHGDMHRGRTWSSARRAHHPK
jgi:DNA invertase Pin-like site-specific DNA recombinase